MADRWSLFIFDWFRYQELLPHLRIACETGDFRLPALEEAAEMLEQFDEREEAAVVCSEVLIELCGQGEPVIFDGGMSEFLHGLRRQPNGLEPADILAELVTAAPNLEEWLIVEEGLAGVLAPGQVRDLADYLAFFQKTYRPPSRPRGLAAIARRFAPTHGAAEELPELIELVNQACAAGLAVAAIREQ